MTSASDEKWRPFNCFFFSVQRTDGSPTGPDPENRVGDQDIGSPGRPVSSGLQCPVSRGIVVQERDRLGELNAATQFLTVAHNGACSPDVSVRMA